VKQISVLALFLAAVACNASDSVPIDDGDASLAKLHRHVLRTYPVPKGHQKTLRRLLESSTYPITVVSKEGQQTQFVWLNPQFTGKGYFVLSAPVGIHDGVKELLSVLENVPPQPSSTINVTYWAVKGQPASSLELDDSVTELEKPLRALGVNMRFSLVEKVSLETMDGKRAIANGRTIDAEHVAMYQDNRIDLAITHLRDHYGGYINTQLSLKPGQFAVVGQAGAMKDIAEREDATMIYIVRASSETSVL